MRKFKPLLHSVFWLFIMVVGESWLLARFTGLSSLIPFFLMLPVFVGGVFLSYSSLRTLTAKRPPRQSSIIAVCIPTALLVIWGAVWGMNYSGDDRVQKAIVSFFGGGPFLDMDIMNAQTKYWFEKGIDDFPNHSPPTRDELLEITRGDEWWIGEFQNVYEEGFSIAKGRFGESERIESPE